jgi:hypothetical protein
MITMHEYKSDPQSGAGNCTCGQAERYRDHFHKFVKAVGYGDLCSCALPASATCHIEMVWVNDHEVIAKSLFSVMAFQNSSKYDRRLNSTGKYDILVEVEFHAKNDMEERYIFEDESLETVDAVINSMKKDLVFGLWDKDAKLTYFRPGEVTKLQINIQ